MSGFGSLEDDYALDACYDVDQDQQGTLGAKPTTSETYKICWKVHFGVRYASSLDSASVDSPSDHIEADDLHVFNDKAVIEKDNLKWARILDTHSMEPVLNANSISLELLPDTSSEISVGDIISYSHDSKVIIHRVIFISEDSSGWYAITKGDNNKEADDYKVRFEQIKGLVVGVLY